MKESKQNESVLTKVSVVSDFVTKVFILLLFCLLFISRINPARISDKMDKSLSMLQSAFYFKSLTSNIVGIQEESSDSDELENPFAFMEEGDSYDDMYASVAAMFDENTADSADDEESLDEDTSFDGEQVKAEKIVIEDYKAKWSEFRDNHTEIAKSLEFDNKASLLTVIAVLICIVGFYLSCGKNKVKKIGYITIACSCVLVCLSMINFNSAFISLNAAYDLIDVSPISPKGIGVYLAISMFLFVFAVISFFTTKYDKEEKSEITATPFQVTYRILALLLFITLFLPGLNPARISEKVSRNVSLLTSGFFYNVYIENMGRILLRGWIPSSVMKLAFFASMLSCLGIIACGVGSCMSVGNNKLKRYGHFCLMGGSVGLILGMFGILRAYNYVISSPNVDKLSPVEPSQIPIFVVLGLFILVCSVISFVRTPAPKKDEKCYIEAPIQLFLMLLPFIILVFIFSYLPLWGWRYAFFDYVPGDILSMDKWVGLKWFKAPFENEATRNDIIRVIRNTLVMSGLGILGSWLPMFFAIFLAEIKNLKLRKAIQTLTTIPNFISWVLVYAIAFCIFGTQGFISSLMVNSGIWESGKNMLMGDSFIWVKMWLWGTWKGLGWSAIMYIAAISGIDQQLYEAATVDGAGRMQKIAHITLPELFPTYIVLLILSVSNLLSNGMEQYLVFKNSTNVKPIQVLDLYVYQLSFDQTSSSNIPFSTVVSMAKSLISVLLLFMTNKISKWIRGTSIF